MIPSLVVSAQVEREGVPIQYKSSKAFFGSRYVLLRLGFSLRAGASGRAGAFSGGTQSAVTRPEKCGVSSRSPEAVLPAARCPSIASGAGRAVWASAAVRED